MAISKIAFELITNISLHDALLCKDVSFDELASWVNGEQHHKMKFSMNVQPLIFLNAADIEKYKAFVCGLTLNAKDAFLDGMIIGRVHDIAFMEWSEPNSSIYYITKMQMQASRGLDSFLEGSPAPSDYGNVPIVDVAKLSPILSVDTANREQTQFLKDQFSIPAFESILGPALPTYDKFTVVKQQAGTVIGIGENGLTISTQDEIVVARKKNDDE